MTFQPIATFLVTGHRNALTLFRCDECAALVDKDGESRHRTWHRGQAGELSPPVIDPRTASLVQAARRAIEAHNEGRWMGPSIAELTSAAAAFPDEVQP